MSVQRTASSRSRRRRWSTRCGLSACSVDMIRVMRQSFEKDGVLSPASGIYLTHLSKGLCAPHDEMAERLAPEGFVVAHDGMAISIGAG